MRGEQPGGIWPGVEVARHAVYEIFDTEPAIESPLWGGK